ncbi:YbaN family protein [Vibrio alfacsensis]|uniref:YbaN family protein n=1 Tax=Vibrio alfacsensis TaxID=1074311 RepID=UPI001C81F6E8|nr:YbaN family protein [Vibrio alfacsensis]WQE75409.1 YbaN family protein [Vibrio alfacsensis]
MESTIRIKRYFFNVAGGLCLILGILGIALPLLPTTPFILLASACFMRGSPAFHSWLHEHKTFGPILKNWHNNRAVTRKVKQRGAVFIVLSFCLSIVVVPLLWVKIALLVMLIVLLSWFIRLPVIELVADREENH